MSDVLNPQAQDIEAATRALTSARETNLGIEVQLPILYPTGHAVTVVVSKEGDDYVVHDAGFGAMMLTNSGVKFTDKLYRRFTDLAQCYGCLFIEGRMSRRSPAEKLPLAIALVANASRVVGDHIMNAKRRSIFDFKKEVSGLAAETIGSDRVRNDEEVIGDSGISYRMNIVILAPDKAHPLAFIETIAEQDAVTGRFRAFYDIGKNESVRDIQRVSVYDDRHEWRAGDLILLQDVSNIVPFSNTKTRIEALAH